MNWVRQLNFQFFGFSVFRLTNLKDFLHEKVRGKLQIQAFFIKFSKSFIFVLHYCSKIEYQLLDRLNLICFSKTNHCQNIVKYSCRVSYLTVNSNQFEKDTCVVKLLSRNETLTSPPFRHTTTTSFIPHLSSHRMVVILEVIMRHTLVQ